LNERIKLLAGQAGMYVDLDGNPWPKWMSAEECELAYAKFAELIVQECDKYVAERWDICEPWMNPGDLLKHFGIEK